MKTLTAAILALLTAGCTAATPGLVGPASVPAHAPAAAPTSTPTAAELVQDYLDSLTPTPGPAVNVADADGWASVEDCVTDVQGYVTPELWGSWQNHGLASLYDAPGAGNPYAPVHMGEQACEVMVNIQDVPIEVMLVILQAQLMEFQHEVCEDSGVCQRQYPTR